MTNDAMTNDAMTSTQRDNLGRFLGHEQLDLFEQRIAVDTGGELQWVVHFVEERGLSILAATMDRHLRLWVAYQARDLVNAERAAGALMVGLMAGWTADCEESNQHAIDAIQRAAQTAPKH